VEFKKKKLKIPFEQKKVLFVLTVVSDALTYRAVIAKERKPTTTTETTAVDVTNNNNNKC
jgi:hypothetical protein